MKVNDKIRAYSAQRGIDSAGAFKNKTSRNRAVAKLTPPQQRRIRKQLNAAN